MTALTAARPAPVAGCSAHRAHFPRPLTIELHHVIPQAWQHVWRPPGADRTVVAAIGLFDPRTVPLCPTGHRNVHAWIVRLMHLLTAEDPAQAAALARVGDRRARGREFDIALLALTRFRDAGGSLESLIAVGQWGEA